MRPLQQAAAGVPPGPAAADRLRPGFGETAFLGRGFLQTAFRCRFLQSAFIPGKSPLPIHRAAAHLLETRRIDHLRRRQHEIDRHHEQRDHKEGQKGDDQVVEHRAPGDVGVAFSLQGAEEPHQDVVAPRLGDHLGPFGQRHVLVLLGEGRRDAGFELGIDDDIADVESRQHEAGEKGPGVELHDRDAGGGAVEDQEDRGRDQDARGCLPRRRSPPRAGRCSRP